MRPYILTAEKKRLSDVCYFLHRICILLLSFVASRERRVVLIFFLRVLNSGMNGVSRMFTTIHHEPDNKRPPLDRHRQTCSLAGRSFSSLRLFLRHPPFPMHVTLSIGIKDDR